MIPNNEQQPVVSAAVAQGNNNLYVMQPMQVVQVVPNPNVNPNANPSAQNQIHLINKDPLGMAVIPSVMNVGVPELGPYTYRACLCCTLAGGIQTISFWYIMIGTASYLLSLVFIILGGFYSLWAFLTFVVYATLHCIPGIKGCKFVNLKSESDYYYHGEKLYVYYLILCTLNLCFTCIGTGTMIMYHYYDAHRTLRYIFLFLVLPWGTHGGFSIYNIYILKQYFREKAFQKWQRESLNRNVFYNNADNNPNNIQLEKI